MNEEKAFQLELKTFKICFEPIYTKLIPLLQALRTAPYAIQLRKHQDTAYTQQHDVGLIPCRTLYEIRKLFIQPIHT